MENISVVARPGSLAKVTYRHVMSLTDMTEMENRFFPSHPVLLDQSGAEVSIPSSGSDDTMQDTIERGFAITAGSHRAVQPSMNITSMNTTIIPHGQGHGELQAQDTMLRQQLVHFEQQAAIQETH